MLTPASLLFQTATGAPKDAPAGMGFADFWGLVELAGPLRWPIFATLAIGVWLAIYKLYELLRDRALGRELLVLDLRTLDLAQIRERVAGQPEHTLASLAAMMLNAHRTGTGESTLHDEITNFTASQQDLFERFRRRMDFLSDTAGALGLLGTVWGMFEVFFQGTPNRDVILRGMGIALMTTLLGLVVSIILNFATTEIFTFFGSRLQQVSSKADELRFRLLELADPASMGSSEGTARTSPVASRARPTPSVPEPRAPSPPQRSSPPAAGTDGWCDLELTSAPKDVRAGEVVQNVELRVRAADGRLPDGVGVEVTGPAVASGNGATRPLRLTPDATGAIRFDWPAPTVAGPFALDAAVVGHPGARRRIELRVSASAPERIEQDGNHQAAIAGMRLANPFIVRVRDRFDNPVPGVPVTFRVTGGRGRLGSQGETMQLRTDATGAAATPFAVSSDAGANLVTASVDGRDDELQFVAFGTAV